MYQKEQRITPQNTEYHQHKTEQSAENAGGSHGGFQSDIIFCTEHLRDDHGAAHITAESKSDEDQSDLITVAHGGQCVFADEFSCHERICYII